MSRYSRMFLHFVHAITNDRDRVHSFIFGTRLTNITRHLQYRDVDVALSRVANAALDWSGGTRIGESLLDFNRFWSRRVLGQGAVVLLITDGLDRGDVDGRRISHSFAARIDEVRYKYADHAADDFMNLAPTADSGVSVPHHIELLGDDRYRGQVRQVN